MIEKTKPQWMSPGVFLGQGNSGRAKDLIGIENRPVHAHTFHGGALGRFNLHRATGAAAHGAGHEFLQGNLARSLIFTGQCRDGFQHGARPAAEDLYLPARVLIQGIQQRLFMGKLLKHTYHVERNMEEENE